MENLVTHAWVNGQWQQQTISRERLMAQHQQQSEPVVPRAEKDPPVYGLLSRTLVHSPVISKIFPAKIRSGSFEDVVFIGVRIFSLMFESLQQLFFSRNLSPLFETFTLTQSLSHS
jgi:hypothetical protein